MAPIGAKLCQNAFQVIPDISFFDAKQICCENFSQKIFRQHPEIFFFNKVPVLEKLCRFTRNYRMELENSLPDMQVSAFYDPWRRGKKGKSCFFPEFWPKNRLNTFFAGKTLIEALEGALLARP